MQKKYWVGFNIICVLVAIGVSVILGSDSAFVAAVQLFPSMHRIGWLREWGYEYFCSGTRRVGTLASGETMENYVVKSLSGEDVPLKKFLGKVVLAVNTASR